MKDMHSEMAVIIGAAGGIGSEYARQLASAGIDLVLVDKNKASVKTLAESLRTSHGIAVRAIQCDLEDDVSTALLAVELTDLKKIDLFVYAAGYKEHRLFHEDDIMNIRNLMHIHISSMVQLVHAVLPIMIEQRKGKIIVVSSLSAFVPAAGSSIYSASKAFINNFLESLHLEVHNLGITIQSLCPGLTNTGFHTAADITELPDMKAIDIWMDAAEVVEFSLDHLGSGKVICIPGVVNKSIHALIHAMPRRCFYDIVESMANKRHI